MKLKRWSLGLCAALALCASSVSAHQEGPVDLHALRALVEAQAAATAAPGADGDRHAAWLVLARKLGRAGNSGLSSDLAKLALVAKHAAGALSGDEDLRVLLGHALDAADTELGEQPAAMNFHIAQLKLQSARNRVLDVVAKAKRHHELGRAARGEDDDVAAAKSWLRSDAAFVRAEALARRLVKKQGGGVGQF